MSSEEKKLALFDVDKTLMRGYSGYFTAFHLIQRGAVRKRHIAKAILYQAISKLYHADVRKMYEIILGDMAGWSLDDVLEIGRKCFEEDIRPRLYLSALSLIEQHKKQGHASYFVTAAPYMTIKILGDFLGVCPDYACGPVIRDGFLQKEIREPLAYGEGKLKVAELIAEREGASLKNGFFYTDNIDDLPLLEAVGHPHAVNPDKKLERHASIQGWPILRFSECLGEGKQ